jgi:hypothetical protein
MNKKGQSYLWGFILLVVGLVIATFTMYSKCIHRVNGFYDTSFSCINSSSFWILIGVGAVIATVGAFIIQNSNRR